MSNKKKNSNHLNEIFVGVANKYPDIVNNRKSHENAGKSKASWLATLVSAYSPAAGVCYWCGKNTPKIAFHTFPSWLRNDIPPVPLHMECVSVLFGGWSKNARKKSPYSF